MKNLNTRFLLALVAILGTCHEAISQEIQLESKYLSTPVSGYHGYQLTGKLDGAARLALDPNACVVNLYGDRTICTRIALTVQDVTLAELEIVDPTGQGRRVFAIDNHGLTGDLNLVTTASNKDGWFVFTERNGQRTVIDLDPMGSSPKAGTKPDPASASCLPLPRTVDGTKAQSKVVAGFVNETWILLLKGKKPNGGTRIEFQPLTYVQQPDYWEINVVECSDGIVIPLVTPYETSFEITSFLGKKGIELVFGDEKIRLEVPPRP